MIECRLCNRSILDGIHLSDGGLIHPECQRSFETKSDYLQKEISSLYSKLNLHERELVRREKIWFKIISLFSKPLIKSSDIEKILTVIKNNILDTSDSLKLIRSQLFDVYDFYLTYPPDWETRKAIVIARDGEGCINCSNTRNLHLHHRRHLSKGGTNEVCNLELLCSNCHSTEHRGRDFTGSFSHNETAFSKRVSDIRYAINQKKQIEFLYKKKNQTSYKKRRIAPIELNNVAHEFDNGQTLCIRGYCELRKEKRNFALKRMKNLKVL